ncbi:MAG: transposase [Candidatus Competibacteraceae bacterium]|nr:transposase [Candidatus Competibacteraceae bacterium]
MSEVKKRKVHGADFKAKVGLEAIRGLKPLNEIGQDYGVHPVQVGHWKKAILDQARSLFEGKQGPRSPQRKWATRIICTARSGD